MFVTTADLCYMIFIITCGVLSVSANLFLLYMITRKSPPHLTPYRIFLGNTALTQLLYSLVMLAVQPRLILHDMNIVVIYLGPAQYLGPWPCYMLYVTLLHFAVNSFISIMLSMVFRCISIRTLGFPVSGAYVMCFLGYIIPFTMVVGVVNMNFVSDAESNNIYTNYTVPHLEKYHTAVGAKIEQPCNLWVIFCTSFLLIPIYTVMYFCRWKIYHMLARPTFIQNTTTKANIQKLVKALTVQSIIPLFTVFPASITYMLAQFNVLHFHMYSYFVISSLSVSAVLDPLVTIYYVSPYRRFTRMCFGLPNRESDSTLRAGSISYEKSSSVRRSLASTTVQRNSSSKCPAVL